MWCTQSMNQIILTCCSSNEMFWCMRIVSPQKEQHYDVNNFERPKKEQSEFASWTLIHFQISSFTTQHLDQLCCSLMYTSCRISFKSSNHSWVLMAISEACVEKNNNTQTKNLLIAFQSWVILGLITIFCPPAESALIYRMLFCCSTSFLFLFFLHVPEPSASEISSIKKWSVSQSSSFITLSQQEMWHWVDMEAHDVWKSQFEAKQIL